MADFFKQDLTGARFEEVDFSQSWMRNVYFEGAVLRGAWLKNADIDGVFDGLRLNGVEVAPLVEAELDRLYPDRVTLRATDAAGLRAAWQVIERIWPPTIERAERLPPEQLHERVDTEYSFIETLRHLLFCTDAWLLRAVLGRPDPYTPLGLPHSEHGPDPDVPNDPDARPSLDEVLALRADRMATVRATLDAMTDEQLAADTEVVGPGYPTAGTYPVLRCVRAVVNEEWLHHGYAVRDLAVLEARGG